LRRYPRISGTNGMTNAAAKRVYLGLALHEPIVQVMPGAVLVLGGPGRRIVSSESDGLVFTLRMGYDYRTGEFRNDNPHVYFSVNIASSGVATSYMLAQMSTPRFYSVTVTSGMGGPASTLQGRRHIFRVNQAVSQVSLSVLSRDVGVRAVRRLF
jgi:hypothetical protein